ncbi:MAG: hypothetical protein Q9212_000695 [Teloschistes hypoglaucus]
MSDKDSHSDISDDVYEPNALDEEDDWQDVEPDNVSPSFVSLSGSTKFPTLEAFLEDARENHGVDLVEMQRRFSLETFGMIKLINFVRSQVLQGLFHPDISPENFLEGDAYLRPAVDEDALLYSLDDLFDYCKKQASSRLPNTSAKATVSQEQVQDMIRERNYLREQAVYYRSALQKTYLEKMELQEHNLSSSGQQDIQVSDGNGDPSSSENENDVHYFSSYAFNDIHETMLQDTIRTDAYRDFIYDNKHLFAGKVVLDVGCGTGILSLFCAKAGAAKVIAVDNSGIIDKAREIVFRNGFGDIIQCLRGKIEEVNLPVKEVDVIVSEWMGYCLLYEAMLDSVIWARDRYLAPGGLMVPSHATLRLSLFADDDYISDKVCFWNSVYGFDMSCMQKREYDDILIRTVKADAVPSDPTTFLEVPLHRIRKDQLNISGAEFTLTASREIDQFHGFIIHFDIFFATDRDTKAQDANLYFSTGPAGPETHWQQALALVDFEGLRSPTLKSGDQVQGKITLSKANTYHRELDVTIDWQIIEAAPKASDKIPKYQRKWLMH